MHFECFKPDTARRILRRLAIFRRTLIFCFVLIVSMQFAGAEEAEVQEKPAAESEAKPDTESAVAAAATKMDPFLPGRHDIEIAERLELRDEPLSALERYCSALREVVREAGKADGKDALALWGRAEFLLEKSYALGEKSSQFGSLPKVIAEIEAYPFRQAEFLARCTWLKSRMLLREGKYRESARLADALGIMRDWLILGAFDNERGRNFSIVLDPEKNPGFAEEHETLREKSSWRRILTEEPSGYVNLSAFFRPEDECLAYAACAVRSSDTREATLRFGSSDMFAAFVNGTPVCSFEAARNADLDQNCANITLSKGWNLLLIKCGNATGAWGFISRLTDRDGEPLKGLTMSANPIDLQQAQRAIASQKEVENKGSETAGAKAVASPLTQAEAGNFSAPTEATDLCGGVRFLYVILSGMSPSDENLARVNYCLGWLLERKGCFDTRRERTMQYMFLRAAKLKPSTGIFYTAFADILHDSDSHRADRDENAARMMLEQAVRLDQNSALPRLMLAHYYLYGLQNLRESERLTLEAESINPLSGRAASLLYDIYSVRGWDAQAWKTIEGVSRRHPNLRDLQLRRGALSLKEGRHRDAMACYEKLLSANALDDLAARGWLESAVRLGMDREIVTKASRLLLTRPYSSDIIYEAARAEQRLERYSGALHWVERALKICPQDHEALALKGNILLSLGRREQAAESFSKALALQPTMVEVKKSLDLIRGERENLCEEIEDLREFAEKYADYSVARGDSRLYLLNERANRINRDGTRGTVVHFVVKVLDSEAERDMATVSIPYDPDQESVEVLSARVLRTKGQIELARVVSLPARRTSARKILQFSPVNRGDVIEVLYRTDDYARGFFGDYFGDVFYFKNYYPTALSRYIIIHPEERPVYVHSTDVPSGSEEKTGGLVRKVWEMRDLPSIELEPYMPRREELSPSVQASTFKSWDELSRWYWHLIRDQYRDNPEIKKLSAKLVKGKNTPEEKVAALYSWVTSNISNVAWEFGVHGYKPYNAETIFARKFGDCKDKSTLLNVMAMSVGLTAHPVLLRALDETGINIGRSREDLSCPLLNHFNHCISAVSYRGKTWYLDPTAQYRDASSLPETDAGAKAVVISPEGANEVTLPTQRANDNLWSDNSRLTLFEDGSATMRQNVKATGTVASFLRAYLSNGYKEGVLDVLTTRRWGKTKSTNVTFEELPNETPPAVSAGANLKLNTISHKEGNTITMRVPQCWLAGDDKEFPLPGRLSDYVPESLRTHDLILPTVFGVESKMQVRLPSGYVLGNLPLDIVHEFPFGRLEVSFSSDGPNLEITRSVRIEQTRIAKENYKEFRRFCSMADESQEIEITMEKTP